MAGYTTVAKVGALAKGTSSAFSVNGRMVALFHTDDGYFAIDDFCPHMGASLSEGSVEGDTVTCPWHAWRFCVCDGTWIDNPKLKVDRFDVRVVAGEIQVLVPPQEETSATKES